jgi:beta-glucosidase
MISLLTDFHSQLWSDIDTRLSPLPKGSDRWKIIHIFPLVAEVPFGIFVSCIQGVNKTLAFLGSFSPWPKLPSPQEDFSSVLQDARQWEKLGDLEDQLRLGHGNPNFLFGTATCTYQDSGSIHCPDSQWAMWEEKKVPENNRSGSSANFFELYKTREGRRQITDKLQELGVNSYRLSIEWSQIQPEEGKWNEVNLQVYVNLCKHLRDHGITPMITLHHFSEPLWFHKKGSFEKEENIDYFIQFAGKVFPPLTQSYRGKPLVEHFCTINEPAIEAFSRFVRGAFSPGAFLNFKRAAHFLKGALKAHCLAYNVLKESAPESVKIGIVHQYLKFVPTNPLLFPITSYMTRLVNDASLNFFSTGKFEFKMPFVNVTDHTLPKPKTDFIGLQYYARAVIGMLGPTGYHAPMTQMPICEDPEGLYEAIIQTHKAYQAPVIVTENGISTHDAGQRSRYLLRALYAAQRAAEVIGTSNFLGYYLWCFSDNFEWDMGMKPQAFGAFSLDGKMKEGAKTYPRILGAWKETWPEERGLFCWK